MNRWMLSHLKGFNGFARSRPFAKPARLTLDTLEDRAVPAVISVSNTNDAGAGSLRAALISVNTSADATNTVNFIPGLTGTITTASDLPTIAKPVAIVGPGAALITVNGAGTFKLFTFDDTLAGAIEASIAGLTITGGKNSTTGGGGVFSLNENVTVRDSVVTGNTGNGVNGGGIRANGGAFTLLNTLVSNNTAPDGGGIQNAGATFIITDSQIENNTGTNGNGTGGYFQSSGSLQDMTNSRVIGNQGGQGAGLFVTGGPSTIVNSLISNNSATNVAGSDGGGIGVAGGVVTLRNVTISGNIANDQGGGINFTSGTLEIRNSTIAFNISDNDNSGASAGGGIFETAGNKAKVFSTIIAKNQQRSDGAATQSDVEGELDATSSNSLFGVSTGLTGVTNGTQGNQVGTAGTPRDPVLNPLAFNGGLTKTHAIQTTSPAKDAGDVTGLGLTNDGRGAPFVRVVGSKADIGAFEIQSAPFTLQVTTAVDENDAVFNAASLSLREALRLAGTDAPTVTFAPALNGQTITLVQNRLVVDRTVDIQGPGAALLTISGNNLFQIFAINNFTNAITVDVKMSGLRLTSGKADPATGGNSDGGGIVTNENLTLDGMVITGNQAVDDGGGVDQQFGTLTIRNSTVSDNKALGTSGVGGGVSLTAGTGTIVIINSTISGNTAGQHGGGVALDVAGNVVIQNSTISGNQAKANGGGVRISAGSLIVNNSTITLNKAESDGAGAGKGGGISIDGGTAKMTGTIVAKNEVGATGANIDISGLIVGLNSLVFNTTGWNQTGSSNNKLNVDPNLAALANNGGPTFTHALPATGPATDPGFLDTDINPDAQTTDQRGTGFPRKTGASIDIGAFELTPNTAPTISDVTNKTTSTAVAVGPLAFTVGDAETAPAALVVTGTSSNTTLVPNANVVIGGSGAARTVTVTPAVGQTGTATITLTVTDAGGLTATDTFTVTVVPATVRSAAGANPASIQAAVDAFRVDLGTLNANKAGSFANGRREINWDGVPDAKSAPNNLPADFFNTTSPRGAVFAFAAGSKGTGFQVSATAANATATPVEFGNLNAQYPGIFQTFSAERLFTTLGDNAYEVRFFVPGTTIPATVSGFGAVFVDVDNPGSSIEYFDVAGKSLGVFQSQTADNGLSFVGVNFTQGERVAKVVVKAGNTAIGPADAVGVDVAVFDDFLYSEPQAITNTTPTISDVANQSSLVNTPIGPITFTIGDAETTVAALVVTGTSSNTTLVPNANVVVGGSDASRTVTVTPAVGQIGTATITLTVTDAGGLTTTDTFIVTVSATPPGTASPVLIGFPQFAAGADVGSSSATLYNPDKTVRFSSTPFGASFTGGVRTAAGDFNGDGVADLVVGTGPGRATQVIVLDGKTQAQLFSVDPFEASFTGGVYVAAGDLNGDGFADLAITPDEGGGPRARVFSGKGFGQLADFFGIEDTNFRGGARAAIGDITGDGKADLVIAAGFGGGPRVAVFSGAKLASEGALADQNAARWNSWKPFGDFLTFEEGLRNGAFVAAGDVNGDGFAELIAGGGPGGGPRVTAFSGKDLLSNVQTPLANFFGGDVNNRGGVRVSVKNLDGDNLADVVVGSGTGAGSRVTAYAGKSINVPTPPELFAFDALAGFSGGVFVG